MGYFVVVGHGAREYALVRKLKAEGVNSLAVLGGTNDALATYVHSVKIRKYEPTEIISALDGVPIECVIFGNEFPLFKGAADHLRLQGIPVVGPSLAVSRLETDKLFSREIGQTVNANFSIDTRKINDREQAVACTKLIKDRFVLKGYDKRQERLSVIFARSGADPEAIDLIDHAVVNEQSPLIFEEFVDGIDSSVYALSDGNNVYFSPAFQDYPFRFECNLGPKTGGMGSVMNNVDHMPFMNPTDYAYVCDYMSSYFAALFEKYGNGANGIYSFQFLKSGERIYFNEVDVRPGDPEIINLLYRLDSKLSEFLFGIASYNAAQPKFNAKASVTRCFVHPDYPNNQNKSTVFQLDEQRINDNNCTVDWGSVTRANSVWQAGPSRVLTISSEADSIDEARGKIASCEECIVPLTGPRLVSRKDIGDYSRPTNACWPILKLDIANAL